MGEIIKTIMVVDEDTNVLKKIKSCLEEENFNVTTARNNKEAMEILENKDTNIDLILLHTRESRRDILVPLINKEDKTIPIGMEIPRRCTKEELMEFINKLSNL